MSKLLTVLVFTLISFTVFSGVQLDSGYNFVIEKQFPVTSIKNQYMTGTCWSFSVLSMLETELLQKGKGEYDLSEMYIVYKAYILKAIEFARLHGFMKMSGGGELGDPIEMIREYGIVPEQVYSGLHGKTNHDQYAMDDSLKNYMDSIVNLNELPEGWLNGFVKILNNNIGEVPQEFDYNGKHYTPASFRDYLGINPDQYIVLTSFTHHPYYSKFILELPDNWMLGEAYNLPLNELSSVIRSSIANNYSLAWACDISEPGFSFLNGMAILPQKDWNDMTNDEINQSMKVPLVQMQVTPETRQHEFDDYETQDDHGMHLIGTAQDRLGQLFYYMKNSWGTDNTQYNGFIYVSESYLLMKTISILVNRNAIPSDIKKKIGLK